LCFAKRKTKQERQKEKIQILSRQNTIAEATKTSVQKTSTNRLLPEILKMDWNTMLQSKTVALILLSKTGMIFIFPGLKNWQGKPFSRNT
jgi:hypothetical protein